MEESEEAFWPTAHCVTLGKSHSLFSLEVFLQNKKLYVASSSRVPLVLVICVSGLIWQFFCFHFIGNFHFTLDPGQMANGKYKPPEYYVSFFSYLA